MQNMGKGPQLGKRIEDGDRRRDAVHIAVAAVTAEVRLSPGQHIGLTQAANTELVGPTDHNIGIVDPFVTGDIEPGQRFWMFLYPDTITGLRHIWTHPAFSTAAAVIREKLR
jgi:hypothetical protein